MKEKILNLENARKKEQKEKMEKILAEGICPFCPKYLEKYHDNPIEKKGKWWSITKNDYPYDGTKLHYMFIHNKHIEDINKINPEAAKELFLLLRWLEKKYKIEGGSILLRFGNMKYTGATVSHLHGHLIVGDVDEPNHQSVKVKVG